MARKIFIVILMAALLSGCKSFKEGFQKGYNESFVKNWKTGFVKSCVGSDKSSEKEQLCTCVADKAVQEMTVEQLSDVKYASKYIEDNILPTCQ